MNELYASYRELVRKLNAAHALAAAYYSAYEEGGCTNADLRRRFTKMANVAVAGARQIGRVLEQIRDHAGTPAGR
jgi:hypothetical protein